jgi:hypothetical protein
MKGFKKKVEDREIWNILECFGKNKNMAIKNSLKAVSERSLNGKAVKLPAA